MEEDQYSEIAKNRYRFGGFRYGFRGPSTCGPDDIIPELPGLFAYPRKEPPAEDIQDEQSNNI